MTTTKSRDRLATGAAKNANAGRDYAVSERIREALGYIDSGDRDIWVRMAMAVKAELGEDGFHVWDAWSQQADNYDPRDARGVWRGIRHDGGIGIGTLFREARLRGWRGDRQRPAPGEAERRRIAAERAAKGEAEIARSGRAEQASKLAAIVWGKGRPASDDNPYLKRKGVSATPTLRELNIEELRRLIGYQPQAKGEPLQGRVLIVPVRIGDRLTTVELIDETGRKSALAGGAKASGFWATQRLPDGDGAGLTLLVGEGVATVVAVSQSAGYPGIAALSCGNLLAAAKAMRERYLKADIVVLADLVKSSGEPDSHAIEAARAVGGRLAVPDFGRNRAPDIKDFNDLLVRFGAEAVKRDIAKAAVPADDDGWPEPQALIAKIEPEPYPMDALPGTIRAAVEEVAGFVKAPVALVASSALAALSLACQAHVDVKRAEKLQGPSSLYLLTIADSGERKSTVDTLFTAAIRQYQTEQAEAAKPLLREYQGRLAAWEAERDGILSAIKEASKKGKPTNDLRADLAELQHEKPQPPRVPRMLLGDETPESLAWNLAHGWPSAGIFSSEAGLILGSHAMGKDSVMRNLALLNILWDGGVHTIGRRTSESFEVRGARLAAGLMVQEATLREFFAKSGQLARGTGFLARFLVSWPASTQGARFFEEPPESWPRLAAFHRRITEILNLPAPMDDNGVLAPAVLSLAPEAKAAWIAFHDAIERELASGGELYDVRDVAAKAADNAARLAALFQVFGHGVGAISLDCFVRASRIVAWHLSESRRFFGELALPGELVDAARLDSWLIEYCKREGTHVVGKNHVRQHGPLRDGLRLDSAIRELAELDRLRLEKDGKRFVIYLSPALTR